MERQQALYIAKSRYSEVADGRIILPINRTMLIGLIVVMLTFWACRESGAVYGKSWWA